MANEKQRNSNWYITYIEKGWTPSTTFLFLVDTKQNKNKNKTKMFCKLYVTLLLSSTLVLIALHQIHSPCVNFFVTLQKKKQLLNWNWFHWRLWWQKISGWINLAKNYILIKLSQIRKEKENGNPKKIFWCKNNYDDKNEIFKY